MWAGGGEKRPIKTWKPVELGKEIIRVNRVQNWIQVHDHHLVIVLVVCVFPWTGGQEPYLVSMLKLIFQSNWSYKEGLILSESVRGLSSFIFLSRDLLSASRPIRLKPMLSRTVHQVWPLGFLWLFSRPLLVYLSLAQYVFCNTLLFYWPWAPDSLVPMTPLNLIYILASKTQSRHCHFLGVSYPSAFCLSFLSFLPSSPALFLSSAVDGTQGLVCARQVPYHWAPATVITQSAFLLLSRTGPTPSASVRALKNPVCKLAK